jgi:hypothetical protein
VTVTQSIDQRDREPATRTVSTNRNVLGCNVLLAQEAQPPHLPARKARRNSVSCSP